MGRCVVGATEIVAGGEKRSGRKRTHAVSTGILHGLAVNVRGWNLIFELVAQSSLHREIQRSRPWVHPHKATGCTMDAARGVRRTLLVEGSKGIVRMHAVPINTLNSV